MVAIVYLGIKPFPLFPIVIFVVVSSIVLHGGSVSLFHFGLESHYTWKAERAVRRALSHDTTLKRPKTHTRQLSLPTATVVPKNNEELDSPKDSIVVIKIEPMFTEADLIQEPVFTDSNQEPIQTQQQQE